MTSRKISIGDMVIVCRPESCGCLSDLGRIFTVAHIDTEMIGNCFRECIICGTNIPVVTDITPNGDEWFAITTVEKINPASEEQKIEREAELVL